MLSLARVQRSIRASSHVGPSSHTAVARTISPKRDLHQTAVALKKKKGSSANDDMFFDNTDDALFSTGEDELFGSSAASKAKAKPSSSPSSSSTVKTTTSSEGGKLSPEARLERFTGLYQFLSDRVGTQPPARKAHEPLQVRTTAWQHLFGLATTKEQLEQVAELFPRWREAKRVFRPQVAEAFIRRCEELHCPLLALKVFSDHPKYGLDLPHLAGARRLLHSLHTEHPLEHSITLSALYAVYKLPPIASDLVSCAMLTSACFKAGTPESLTVADALVPQLKTLLEKAKPEKMAYPEDKYVRKVVRGGREKAWLRWTLGKVEAALEARKESVDWLREWRRASGHVAVPA